MTLGFLHLTQTQIQQHVFDAFTSGQVFEVEEDEVISIETPLSSVSLVGERAYKILKAVNMGLGDTRQLKQRRRVLSAELDHGQRVSPGLHIGVLPIRMTPKRSVQLVGDASAGPIVDWALVMHRLHPENALPAVLDVGVPADLAVRLANRVAEFHVESPLAYQDDASRYMSQWAQDYRGLLDRLRTVSQAAGFEFDAEFVLGFVTRFFPVLAQEMLARCERGEVRRVHGDLHLHHIWDQEGTLYMIDPQVQNPAFAKIDRWQELAFLSASLIINGHEGFSAEVREEYLRRFDDPQESQLLEFLMAHAYLVRTYSHLIYYLETKETPHKMLASVGLAHAMSAFASLA